MLSVMQLRLREEYDIENTVIITSKNIKGDMLSYGVFENITRQYCMSVEDVVEEMWEM
jgi:hypothetical protein